MSLAVLLAAKEAVFKAMGDAEGRLACFSDVCVMPGRNAGQKNDLKISFVVRKKYVVVQCAGI